MPGATVTPGAAVTGNMVADNKNPVIIATAANTTVASKAIAATTTGRCATKMPNVPGTANQAAGKAWATGEKWDCATVAATVKALVNVGSVPSAPNLAIARAAVRVIRDGLDVKAAAAKVAPDGLIAMAIPASVPVLRGKGHAPTAIALGKCPKAADNTACHPRPREALARARDVLSRPVQARTCSKGAGCNS